MIKNPLAGFGVQSEIYAFGLVLIEILTGMNVYKVGKQTMVRWATNILLADNVNSGTIGDPQLGYDSHASEEALELALLVSNCLRPLEEKRPSMEVIVQVLCHCYEEATKTAEIKEPEI